MCHDLLRFIPSSQICSSLIFNVFRLGFYRAHVAFGDPLVRTLPVPPPRLARARIFWLCVGYAVQLGRWVTAAFRVVSEFCSSAGHMSSGMSFCRMRVVQFCWACGVFFCRIQGFLDTRGCVWFTRGLRAVREIGLLGWKASAGVPR